jgi:hypothetical protein
LISDLDCSAFVGASLTIAKDGTLDLAGFTVTGGSGSAIICEKDCTIVGPGTVQGAQYHNIAATGWVTVNGATVLDSGSSSIIGKSVTLNGCTVSGTGASSCVGALKRIVVSDSVISDCDRAALEHVYSDKGRMDVSGSDIEGNKYGVAGKRISIVDTFIHNNQEYGVRGTTVTIEDSSVTGNWVPTCDPDGSQYCNDIQAVRLRVSNVTCNTSAVLERVTWTKTGENWGVCANDY